MSSENSEGDLLQVWPTADIPRLKQQLRYGESGSRRILRMPQLCVRGRSADIQTPTY
jgi:hypothetical protein